jgi:hypothetical protein
MWEAGPRPRWWRCVDGQKSASVEKFESDSAPTNGVWEQRARDVKEYAAPGCRKRAKQMATEQQRAEESTRGEAMRKKRTRMRQDAEVQPSLAWKWSSWFLERPPSAESAIRDSLQALSLGALPSSLWASGDRPLAGRQGWHWPMVQHRFCAVPAPLRRTR